MREYRDGACGEGQGGGGGFVVAGFVLGLGEEAEGEVEAIGGLLDSVVCG